MATRTEIHRDYHANGVTRRIVERVEYGDGRADLHESFISESGVRFSSFLGRIKVLTVNGKVLCDCCHEPEREPVDRVLKRGDTYSDDPCDLCGAVCKRKAAEFAVQQIAKLL